MPDTVVRRPVVGKIGRSPVCVSVAVQRLTTTSPSSYCASTVITRSGNAAVHPDLAAQHLEAMLGGGERVLCLMHDVVHGQGVLQAAGIAGG
jgi:hypothetical protein